MHVCFHVDPIALQDPNNGEQNEQDMVTVSSSQTAGLGVLCVHNIRGGG